MVSGGGRLAARAFEGPSLRSDPEYHANSIRIEKGVSCSLLLSGLKSVCLPHVGRSAAELTRAALRNIPSLPLVACTLLGGRGLCSLRGSNIASTRKYLKWHHGGTLSSRIKLAAEDSRRSRQGDIHGTSYIWPPPAAPPLPGAGWVSLHAHASRVTVAGALVILGHHAMEWGVRSNGYSYQCPETIVLRLYISFQSSCVRRLIHLT